MYPPGLTNMYSYLETRNPSSYSDKTLFFGLQGILNKLAEPLSALYIEDLRRFCSVHFGSTEVFNRQWRRLFEKHHYWPVRIKAVPEGTLVPIGNVLLTIENTDPEFPWVTNLLETLLLQVWYPTTVATYSYAVKKICKQFLFATTDTNRIDGHLQFMLHDFGFRGASSYESAGIAGAAHLVSFSGTDTIAAFEYIVRNYSNSINFDWKTDCVGFSIPATEHSIMTMLGEEGEVQTIQNVLNAYPTGLLAMVIDSYDPYQFIDKLAENFRKEVETRQGRIVLRPDSGDPIEVSVKVLERIGQYFTPTVNSKGYRVLPDYIRVIYGDGININSIKNILTAMQQAGWAAENIVFGCGGKLLQSHNRDNFGFALKTSSVIINGKTIEVFKNPSTQINKISKRGRLGLVLNGDGFTTVSEIRAERGGNYLRTVLENGKLFNIESFDTIKKRTQEWFSSENKYCDTFGF